jgi:transposase-like protein
MCPNTFDMAQFESRSIIKTFFPIKASITASSMRFVSYKDIKQVCADLRAIYTAPSEDAGRSALDAVGARWNQKYPLVSQAWATHWTDHCKFFKYPPEIRRVIYTTNAIESLNYQLRKVTRNRSTAATALPRSTMTLS